MIQQTKTTDECRQAGPVECWLLHGSVGLCSDWRATATALARAGIGSRSVDLWRFLCCEPLPLTSFGEIFHAGIAGGNHPRASRILTGYSLGGRLALHALLADSGFWQGAVILSAHPGLPDESSRAQRRAADATRAAQALQMPWPDFLEMWNKQPILGGGALRDADETRRLMSRRREIARSFIDWSLGAQEPLLELFSTLKIPILWIAGERDEAYRRHAESAVGRLPNARLALAPGAGHRVPWQAADWFHHELIRFCQLTHTGEIGGNQALST